MRAAGHVLSWEALLQVLDTAFSLRRNWHAAGSALRHDQSEVRGICTGGGSRLSGWHEPSTCSRAAHRASPVQLDGRAVACAHGTAADAERVLHTMCAAGLAPTHFTFNTVLAGARTTTRQGLCIRCGQCGRRALPDEATFNTLLKLCVRRNDMDGARRVLQAMQNGRISSDYAKTSMIRLLFPW